MNTIKSGTWVEIEKTLLTTEQRAPQVPDDTKKTPYLMRVAGFLVSDSQLNDEVEVKTLSGRLIKGTLKVVKPHYEHSFGDIVEELLDIGLVGSKI